MIEPEVDTPQVNDLALRYVRATKAVCDAAEEAVDSHEAKRPMRGRMEALARAVEDLREARARIL